MPPETQSHNLLHHPGSRPPTLPVALTLNAACPPQARNDDAGAVVGVGLIENHGQLLGRWVKHVGASEYLVQGLYTRPCVHSHRLSLSLGTTGGFCMVVQRLACRGERCCSSRVALLLPGGIPSATGSPAHSPRARRCILTPSEPAGGTAWGAAIITRQQTPATLLPQRATLCATSSISTVSTTQPTASHCTQPTPDPLQVGEVIGARGG